MTNKKFEEWVLKVAKKYQSKLLLDRYEISVSFKEETNYLESNFLYPYLQIMIFYSDKAVNSWKIGHTSENAIIHEMCHAITDPLYCMATDRWTTKEIVEEARETLTDHIANMIYKLK